MWARCTTFPHTSQDRTSARPSSWRVSQRRTSDKGVEAPESFVDSALISRPAIFEMFRLFRTRLARRESDGRLDSLLRQELWAWVEAGFGHVPGRLGRSLRALLYDSVVPGAFAMDVAEHTHIRRPDKLRCGNRVFLGRSVQIICTGGVEIGDDVMIAGARLARR